MQGRDTSQYESTVKVERHEVGMGIYLEWEKETLMGYQIRLR